MSEPERNEALRRFAKSTTREWLEGCEGIPSDNGSIPIASEPSGTDESFLSKLERGPLFRIASAVVSLLTRSRRQILVGITCTAAVVLLLYTAGLSQSQQVLKQQLAQTIDSEHQGAMRISSLQNALDKKGREYDVVKRYLDNRQENRLAMIQKQQISSQTSMQVDNMINDIFKNGLKQHNDIANKGMQMHMRGQPPQEKSNWPPDSFLLTGESIPLKHGGQNEKVLFWLRRDVGNRFMGLEISGGMRGVIDGGKSVIIADFKPETSELEVAFVVQKSAAERTNPQTPIKGDGLPDAVKGTSENTTELYNPTLFRPDDYKFDEGRKPVTFTLDRKQKRFSGRDDGKEFLGKILD